MNSMRGLIFGTLCFGSALVLPSSGKSMSTIPSVNMDDPRGPTLPPDEVQKIVQLLEPPASPSVDLSKARRISSYGNCIRTRLQVEFFDPIAGEIKSFHVIRSITNFRPSPGFELGPRPAVVVIPTIEDATPLEVIATRSLCERGIQSVYPEDISLTEPPKVYPDLGNYDLNIRRNVYLIKKMIDVLFADPGVNKDRIGIFAASFGAIMSPMVMATDARVRAAVLVTPAVDFPSLLTLSEQRIIKDLRERQMSGLGISDPNEFRRLLSATNQIDGAFLSPFLNKDDFLLVKVEGDIFVPTLYQDHFSNLIGRPTEIRMTGPHPIGIISFVLTRFQEAVRFFESRFYF